MKVSYGKDEVTILLENEWINFMEAEEIYEHLVSILLHSPSTLILDLLPVRFMDCRAIGLLIQVAHMVRNNGNHFVIRHPNTYVRLLIDILQLETVFDVER